MGNYACPVAIFNAGKRSHDGDHHFNPLFGGPHPAPSHPISVGAQTLAEALSPCQKAGSGFRKGPP